jgi:hypothetical protein
MDGPVMSRDISLAWAQIVARLVEVVEGGGAPNPALS